jgi:hypothetical protein
MRDGLTEVALAWYSGVVERWIRFGEPIAERILDRRRRIVSFAPGQVFALIRWQANDHGTVLSRIDILRAAAPGEAVSTLPCVSPGAEILLRLSSWPKAKHALDVIAAIEAQEIDPCEVAPEYWRHAHNRLLANERPRIYSREQHRAWLLRRRVAP